MIQSWPSHIGAWGERKKVQPLYAFIKIYAHISNQVETVIQALQKKIKDYIESPVLPYLSAGRLSPSIIPLLRMPGPL